MENINSFNMATLVSMVNDLGGTATMKTFSQRSKAVERITKLAEAQKVDLTKFFDADGKKAAVKAKAEKAPKAPKEPKEKKISIRSVAEALLLKVAGEDKDGRATGLSYEDILAEIKGQFPEAKTTIGCLRWYAASMRDAGTTIPARPRAVAEKAVAAPAAEVEVAAPVAETEEAVAA